MKNALLCTALIGLNLSFATDLQASTLIHNVKGYTLTADGLTQFVAVEFDDGKITGIYANTADLKNSQAEHKIDGNGNVMLPGLIDAHGHVLSHGKALSSVALRDTKSEADAVQRVMTFMLENPGFS